MTPALILAAGLGTRLDPLTRLVAKPAVPLGDRSLLERILDHLRHEGVDDVVVNLHYRPETITRLVGDGATRGLRVRYSWEREILGSAGGPRRALALLDADTFFIVNGDTICDFPLAPMLAAHERSSADVTMAVVRNPAPQHYNGIRATDDGVVRGFVPKGPEAAGTWHFVGVQIADAGVFASLPDGVPAETVAGLYRAFVTTAPGRVSAYPVDAPFVDVGTPRDYLDAARRFPAAGPLMSGLADSIVWPGMEVAPGARLTRCVVACAVPTPVEATDAVLVPSAVARPGDACRLAGPVAIFPFAGLL
jgi:NDP-sugar pyrophosphorylase family protein